MQKEAHAIEPPVQRVNAEAITQRNDCVVIAGHQLDDGKADDCRRRGCKCAERVDREQQMRQCKQREYQRAENDRTPRGSGSLQQYRSMIRAPQFHILIYTHTSARQVAGFGQFVIEIPKVFAKQTLEQLDFFFRIRVILRHEPRGFMMAQ